MKKCLLFVLLGLIINAGFSQGKFNFKKEFIKAERAMQIEDYETALKSYLTIFNNDTVNANVNYKIGWIYFIKMHNHKKALRHFESAVKDVSPTYLPNTHKEKKSPPESYNLLAECYHKELRFQEAIEMFDQYRPFVLDKFEVLQKLDIEKNYSINAMALVQNPVTIEIHLLSNAVNSEFDDHSPVITADESMMVFTSRRKGSTGNIKTRDGKFFEDIYMSKMKDNEWQPAEKISVNINTIEHEASIALSSDGRELFIYRDDIGVGNIYSSKYIDEIQDWSRPVKLGSNISTTSNETHASLSPDGQTLYFTSDRDGGKGGFDIYRVRRLPNGEWGWAENCGDIINTPYDDTGPYMHQDGTTLYFSSKGHNSMGGFDLFSSSLKDDSTFTEPKNLGYPINTINDDAFYVLSADGKRAYYSKEEKGGYGGQDVYMMDLLSLPERSFVVISGTIQKESSNEIVQDLTIEVKDAETMKVIGKYRPNKNNGSYLIVVERGKKYLVSPVDSEVEFVKNVFSVPRESSFFYSKQTLPINPIGVIK